ncbi:uncharacterized protein VP01_799g5 [Puccinia sorghi]|uniref:Retrotransposon gag domain-containing protein n=1 Tax=Puccinia sorghi TaxID=27349 RepID=A0A0L6UBG4_9BASI|nr:uncharacterized protein VP01_799g5 [Puccinia sorghi]
MDTVNARLDELMPMMGLPQHHGWPTKTHSHSTRLRSRSCLQPQPFYGTCGTAAEAFVGQIGLHAITYPESFPSNASKVAFSVSFMKDYTATWSQPYLDKVFNRKPVVLNDFLNDFRSSFFDHKRRHHAKVALRNLFQTETVLPYTRDFKQHTRTMGEHIACPVDEQCGSDN